jgi:DNA-binding NarL/FixJ family response regulator
VVDDFEAWRLFVSSRIQKELQFEIIGEASDGLEAIQKAQELQPDLILLDIGLPTINGIEATNWIHQVAPRAKILFASQIDDPNVVRAALSQGAQGYLVKTDAGRELVPAAKAVIGGETFVSSRLRHLPEFHPALLSSSSTIATRRK